jgi:methionyl-tRNA formyltransferase
VNGRGAGRETTEQAPGDPAAIERKGDMRLIVNGQQAFGRAALEKILEAGKDEVVGVYTSPDKEGRPVDPVKEAALEHGLPLFQPPNYKDKDVLDQMRALDADLMVMAYMIIFVPEEARSIPKHGSICFHPSLLPLHRGPSSINWPIIWGSTRTGLSWFFPDDGLDEGDILLQRECDIGPDETLGDIYFKKIFPLGISTTLEAIDLIRGGNPPHIKQDESNATYESWCRKKDVQIDWGRPVADVYNMIRGANPQPGAWTRCGARRGRLCVRGWRNRTVGWRTNPTKTGAARRGWQDHRRGMGNGGRGFCRR